MAVRVVKMPDIGEGIAEVELVAWHVREGDAVAEDQPLADVMTDKASVEIPSPVAGRIVALGGEIGQTMAVGSELVRIAVGEDAGAGVAPAAAAETPPPATIAHGPAGERAPAPAPAPVPVPVPTPARAPASVGTPAVPPAPGAGLPTTTSSPAAAPAERPIASPSIRRRAWELDVDLAKVHGTGGGGRIMRGDLDTYVAQCGPTAAPATMHPIASRAVSAAIGRTPGGASTAEGGDRGTAEIEAVRVIGLRRQIAQRMQDSKRRIPHFTYVEEIDATDVEALRTELNLRYEAARGRLTLLPFLARAIVLAVREFPQVNARYDDDAGVVNRHRAVHLGIATQTVNGLLVPVVHDAHALDLWQTAREVARLAERARSGHATRDELTGSTITVTSLGALGGIVSTPVINPPEVAVIGVNRIVERPVIRAGGIVARKTMNLSSSFDHRVVDGADAARFIQAVRARLEVPALLFLEAGA
ncbi:MAG TPA: dihydrolipoamide acetyltransferase family protein [Casimicrobiaceae bacterium]|nr:dihydrolipoamide acetyltransferase family protein [Casimicrobiaceae bacterium]